MNAIDIMDVNLAELKPEMKDAFESKVTEHKNSTQIQVLYNKSVLYSFSIKNHGVSFDAIDHITDSYAYCSAESLADLKETCNEVSALVVHIDSFMIQGMEGPTKIEYILTCEDNTFNLHVFYIGYVYYANVYLVRHCRSIRIPNRDTLDYIIEIPSKDNQDDFSLFDNKYTIALESIADVHVKSDREDKDIPRQEHITLLGHFMEDQVALQFDNRVSIYDITIVGIITPFNAFAVAGCFIYDHNTDVQSNHKLRIGIYTQHEQTFPYQESSLESSAYLHVIKAEPKIANMQSVAGIQQFLM